VPTQGWNRFCICSASNEICITYAQPEMKFVLRMSSIFWMMLFKWVVISPFCWACTKIGYSLVEQAWKLVTRWLSMRENCLLVGWAWAKIGYSLAEHMWKSLFLFLVSCPLFPVSRICFLPTVRCPQYYVSVPLFLSTVPLVVGSFDCWLRADTVYLYVWLVAKVRDLLDVRSKELR
jgi:hypothetical protein